MAYENRPSLLELEIKAQEAQAERLVERITTYTVHFRNPDFIERFGEGDYQLIGRPMEEIIKRYHEAEDVGSKLLAAEDLSDLIIKMLIEDKVLPDRCPAADAQLDYREIFPQEGNRCSVCDERPKVFSLDLDKEACVRCYFEGRTAEEI